MDSEFEIARANYIRLYKEFKEAVMDIAATAPPEKVQQIMGDVAHDLARIEDAGWDATKGDDD